MGAEEACANRRRTTRHLRAPNPVGKREQAPNDRRRQPQNIHLEPFDGLPEIEERTAGEHLGDDGASAHRKGDEPQVEQSSQIGHGQEIQKPRVLVQKTVRFRERLAA